MINDNHAVLLDLWSRLKSHIAPKERLEVADLIVAVFDEYGMVDEDFLEEDLDKELRAAARTYLVNPDYEDHDEGYDEDSY